MGKISLLHISDLHIAKTPNLTDLFQRTRQSPFSSVADVLWHHRLCASYGEKQLEALIKLITDEQHRLEAIAITGDIATTGFSFDLHPALEVVNGFDNIVPVFLLPGNHDRYKALLSRSSGKPRGLAPGGTKFYDYFHSYWNNDVEIKILETYDFALGIIAADFNLRDIWDADFSKSVFGSIAQGKVYDDILDRLVYSTEQFFRRFSNEKTAAVVWAIHFPALAPRRISPDSELIGSEKLIERAAENGVIAILSGHVHYGFPPLMDQNIAFLGAGTTTQFGSDNHCQIISFENIDEDVLIAKEDYGFNPKLTKFVRIKL